jgi:ribonuclease BN (tRNA processing enzyme)
MEVIVLGGSGTFPRAGGACNGFLVRRGNTNILLDMGTGVLSRLYTWLNPGKLDALVITHLHPDHFLDVYPYRYFLEFQAAARMPLPVFAPAGAAEHIRYLFNEPDTTKFDRVFSFTDLASEPDFKVGSLAFSGKPVKHLEPTYGISVEGEGKRLFYTSDTAYDERLINYARGADLLLADTTLRAEDAGTPVAHMTTTEVATLAASAGVPRLVLTHLWPHFDRLLIKSEVSAGFDGKIYLADEGLLVKV